MEPVLGRKFHVEFEFEVQNDGFQLQEGKNMSDDFKDYLSNYKKDPQKEYESKKEKARRKANKPPKNLFNFKFWEWMG